MTVKELMKRLSKALPENEVEVLFWDGTRANFYNTCGVALKCEGDGKLVIFCNKVLK